jgi:nucleotide-binding universal stress UspA family protein
MDNVADDACSCPELELQTEVAEMAAKILISYDGTDNDRDALALGKALAGETGELALAYVTHAAPSPGEQAHAAELLRKGALELDVPDAAQHVELNASTPDGLRDLAAREGADIVVFGSEYRTAAGTVSPGTSAQRLLNGAPFAVAIAPAELRSRAGFAVGRVGVLAEAGDTAPGETASRIAAALGASVIEPGNGPVDLLVVGSRSSSPAGVLQLSATAEYAIETASSPVLALPRERAATVGATPAATRATPSA